MDLKTILTSITCTTPSKPPCTLHIGRYLSFKLFSPHFFGEKLPLHNKYIDDYEQYSGDSQKKKIGKSFKLPLTCRLPEITCVIGSDSRHLVSLVYVSDGNVNSNNPSNVCSKGTRISTILNIIQTFLKEYHDFRCLSKIHFPLSHSSSYPKT